MSNEQTEALAVQAALDKIALYSQVHGVLVDSDRAGLKIAHETLSRALATPSPAPSDTLERREDSPVLFERWWDTAPQRNPRLIGYSDKKSLAFAAFEAGLALSLPAREVSGERVLRREGIVAFSADIENPRVLKLHFDQDVTSAHRTLILDAINARRAALATTPAPREKIEGDLEAARTLLARAEPALNAAFAQADAEFRDQDKIAARHDAIVRQFRSDVRSTLNRLSGEG